MAVQNTGTSALLCIRRILVHICGILGCHEARARTHFRPRASQLVLLPNRAAVQAWNTLHLIAYQMHHEQGASIY